MVGVVVWQRIEDAVVFMAALSIFLFIGAGFSWWLAVLLFFAPDVSFAAYLLGPKVGAFGYNIVHVYAFGAVFLAGGLVSDVATVSALGALWLAHSGFDRILVQCDLLNVQTAVVQGCSRWARARNGIGHTVRASNEAGAPLSNRPSGAYGDAQSQSGSATLLFLTRCPTLPANSALLSRFG